MYDTSTELVDRLEIGRISALYCQLIDDGLFERLDEVFTPGGSFTAFGKTHAGLDAIRRFLERAQTPERRGKHLAGIPIVSVAGDKAVAATDVVFFARMEGGWAPSAVGRYSDELVRTTGGWRLDRRDFLAI